MQTPRWQIYLYSFIILFGLVMAIPNMFTVRIRAMRILGEKLDQVVDAASPGGSGDIYAGLSPVQVDALREATRLGFPPQAWYTWRTMGIHGLAALYLEVNAVHGGYDGRPHPVLPGEAHQSDQRLFGG